MNSSEKLCLKWNDYQDNIVSAYRELREAHEFGDVTLVCEDNQKIESHKVILASASKFFKTILIENQHSHPLIYMRGIKTRDLSSVLDFIYHGEASICEEDLNDFLTIAEELELKGLYSSNQSDKEPYPNAGGKVVTIENKGSPQFMSSNSLIIQDTFTTEAFNVDEKETSFSNTVCLLDRNSVMDARTSVSFKDENTELDKKINSMLQKVNDIWTCTVCGKTDNNNRVYNIKKHIESHIEGLAHPCGHCGKTFRSRNILQSHLSRVHRF